MNENSYYDITDGTVTQISPLVKNRKLIFVNDEPVFALYDTDIKKIGLNVGDTINSDIAKHIYEDILYERGLKRSLLLLQSRDYTAYQIRLKLTSSHYPCGVSDKIIETLTEKGFTDDFRYASIYIDTYSGRKPIMMIKNDLLKKGIKSEIIDEAYNKCIIESGSDPNESEKCLCMKILFSKFPKSRYETLEYKDTDFLKLKNRALSYLARKGFSFETVDKCAKEYFDMWGD